MISPWVMWTVLAGHFVSAFAALGMPPFFPLILSQRFGDDSGLLAGWLYGLPILMTALTAPAWGRLADRVGVRPMLVRAQLGLALSFLLAGYAQTTTQFMIALALQGALGGTFAASNAYLAQILTGRLLRQALTRTQASARAALVIAPLMFGVLALWLPPIELYRYLAWLPVLAAFGTLCLPTAHDAGCSVPSTGQAHAAGATLSLRQLYGLQFLFVLGTVITFPYFVSFVMDRLAATTALAGLLFGLPHLVYLLTAGPLGRFTDPLPPIAVLGSGLALLVVSLLGQGASHDGFALTAWRLLMGIAMTLGYVALHDLIASAVRRQSAGASMGRLDSSAKWGGVLAGVAAGLVFAQFGQAGPFLVAAMVIALATSLTLYWARGWRTRPGFLE